MDYALKIVEARDAGYTESQIVEHLAKLDARVRKALDAGHPASAILGRLVSSKPTPAPMVPAEDLPRPTPNAKRSRREQEAAGMTMEHPLEAEANRAQEARLAESNTRFLDADIAAQKDPELRALLEQERAKIAVPAAPAAPRASQADVRRSEPAAPAVEDRTFDQMQAERAALEAQLDTLDKGIANLERTVPLRAGPAQDAALARIEKMKEQRTALQAQIDRTGVGSTGRTVGGLIGAIGGGIVGSAASPIIGTMAGSAGGTVLGSAFGSLADLELAKRKAVQISDEDARKHIRDGVITDFFWDVGGNVIMLGGGRVYRALASPQLRSQLHREVVKGAIDERAAVATQKADKAVEEIVAPSPRQMSTPEQLGEQAAVARNEAEAVRQLGVRSEGAIPSPGQVSGKAGVGEKIQRALHPEVFHEAGEKLQTGAERMRRELVSPRGQPSREELGRHLVEVADTVEKRVKGRTQPVFRRAAEANVEVDFAPMVAKIDDVLEKDAKGVKRLLTDGERNDLMSMRKELEGAGDADFPRLLDAAGKEIEPTGAQVLARDAEGTLDFISGNKARMRKMIPGEGTPSKYYTGVLAELNDLAEGSYEMAARKTGNSKLYSELKQARKDYGELMQVKYSDDVAKALDSKPEDVGRLFWQTGNVSELKQLQNLTNLAVKEGSLTKEAQQAMHADWMRGYLAEAVQNVEQGAKWSDAMKDPRKRDTYDAFRSLSGTGDIAAFMEVFEQAAKIAGRTTQDLAPALGAIGNLPQRAGIGLMFGFLSATKGSLLLGGAGLAKAFATASVNGNKGIVRDIMMVTRAAGSGNPAATAAVRAALTRISQFAADNGIEDPVQTIEGEQ